MLTPEPLLKIKFKNARHKKEHLLISAEISAIHKTNPGFDFVPGMGVISNYPNVRLLQKVQFTQNYYKVNLSNIIMLSK